MDDEEKDDSEEQGDPEQPEPKISIPEALLIGFYILILDLIDLIPFAGDFTDFAVLPINFFLYLKGVKGIYFALSEIADLFPGIQAIPWRTIVWIGTIILDRRPSRLTQALEKFGEVEGGGSDKLSEELATSPSSRVMAARDSVTEATEMRDQSNITDIDQWKREQVAAEEGGSEEQEEGKSIEDTQRDAEIDERLKLGNEVSPFKQAQEEVFNPFKENFGRKPRQPEDDYEDKAA